MHWEILDNKRIRLLKSICENTELPSWYMAGGTALSLQLGLRRSYDFDFFVRECFNPHDVYRQLQNISEQDITVVHVDNKGTCDVLLDGVQVSFFHYPYSLVSSPVQPPEEHGLSLASMDDISAMKAVAIGNRGAKKDFFDLYHILHQKGFSASRLVRSLYTKFGNGQNFAYICMGLNYFDDAEDERLPEAFVEYNWNEIKSFFSAFQCSFLAELESREAAENMD